jgi:hypothetical protein
MASIAMSACQWSGVQIQTASMSVRRLSSRKSLYVGFAAGVAVFLVHAGGGVVAAVAVDIAHGEDADDSG